MSPKSLNQVLTYKMISESVIDYLEDKKNREELVEEALKKVKKNTLFKKKLEKDDNLSKFIDSILNEDDGHIAWIQKDLFKPKQISFKKYNRKTLSNLDPIYCMIYEEMYSIASKMDDRNIGQALMGYFNGFIKASS